MAADNYNANHFETLWGYDKTIYICSFWIFFFYMLYLTQKPGIYRRTMVEIYVSIDEVKKTNEYYEFNGKYAI